MRKYRAAILGYYGFGNLGDELLLSACLAMFDRCGVSRDSVVVLSNSPAQTSRDFGVASVNRWAFREVVSALRKSDTLLLGGGGLFQDSTSILSCAWYWALVRLAKFLGCRVWSLGQSVGPLKSRVSRMLAGNALSACCAVHVRDEKSLALAADLGCKDVKAGSDLVMTLAGENLSHHGEYMLVNLRPCRELDKFAGVIAPHITGRVVGAALSDEDLKALGVLGLQEVVRVRSLHEAEKLWAGASCAVGMRLHFGVLSRLFRTPLAVMPYDVKVSEFASQSGVPCIVDEWRQPVMPLPVQECAQQIDSICREILAL